MTLDGVAIEGGLIDGHGLLLAYNLAGAVAIVGYSFVVTLIILYLINLVPGLNFRPNEHDEHIGGDLGEMGEVAYELLHHSLPTIKDMKEGKSDTTVHV